MVLEAAGEVFGVADFDAGGVFPRLELGEVDVAGALELGADEQGLRVFG